MTLLRRAFIYYIILNHIAVTRQYILLPPSLQSYTNYDIYASKGDINLGYILDANLPNRGSPGCSGAMMASTCAVMAAAPLAIERINNSTDLLPNITLGIVIADACYMTSRALEVSLHFVKEAPRNKSNCTNEVEESSKSLKPYDVVGIVGPSLTDAAIAVSPLMGIYKIPVIGLYPTTDELSQKDLYPYFTRLVAPDGIVVEGLLDIITRMNWSYVTLAYEESQYGQNAASQVDRLIRQKGYNICIAVAIKIPTDATNDDYDQAVKLLLENTKARIVITFTTPTQLETLVGKLSSVVSPGYFLWVGSNTLVPIALTDPSMIMLEGSIFLDHVNKEIPQYNEYLNSPALFNSGNMWFEQSWQNTYNCTFPGKPPRVGVEAECKFDPAKVKKVCYYEGWVARSRIYDGSMVFASSIHRLVQENCPKAFQEKHLLRPCVKGELLLKYIYNISIDGLIGKIQFNQNGDVVEQFAIKQFQKDATGQYKKMEIGGWDEKTRLKVYDKFIRWDIFRRSHLNNTEDNMEDIALSNTNSSEQSDGPIESLCSKPCKTREYLVSQSSICCWTCAKCRDNEIVSINKTSCQSCPENFWPDSIDPSICAAIDPTHLQPSHPISIAMLAFAILGSICCLIVVGVYIYKGNHKLVKATSRQLCLVILSGIMLATVGVILFTLKPSSSGICTAQGVVFHLSINVTYAPLLVKNIRIYRVFATALKGNQRTSFSGNAWQMSFVFGIVAIQITQPSSATLNMPSQYEAYVELFCNKPTTSFLVPLSFNILLICICAIIGFITRKLPDNFNESWFIFISTTTTLFSWAVFIPAYFTMFYAYLQPVILGFSLVLVSFVTLGCQFGPILYAVAFVPNDRLKMTITHGTNSTTGGHSSIVHPAGKTSDG